MALSLTLGLSLAACGGDDDGGDGGEVNCDTSTLTYANFGEQFMTDYCTGCHDEALSGADRGGAPSNVNLNSQALVQGQSARVLARAVEAISMPPSSFASQPSQQERDDLGEWLDCGAN